MTDTYTKIRWVWSENLLENGKHEKNLEKPIQIKYKKTEQKKKLLYWSILEEKIYAFKHDIKTKNIGEIHIYHGDTSILTEKNEKRKCIRHTTIKNSSYLR